MAVAAAGAVARGGGGGPSCSSTGRAGARIQWKAAVERPRKGAFHLTVCLNLQCE